MTTLDGTYRLITRSDFDGLVCAVLLKKLGILDDIKFVHPKDMQDGTVEVTDRDILTNVPYVPGCAMCFDHHASESERNASDGADNHILSPHADSAARVVYDFFGGAERFPNVSIEMMKGVDKADSARFSRDDILEPDRWELLSFLMDARTGLGRFRTFRVSNYQLMMHLIDFCTEHTVEEILALSDVKERVDLYMEHRPLAREQIARCSSVHGPVVVLDLRDEETIWCTNRFTIYAMHPHCKVSIHVMWGKDKQNTVFAVGRSILDRSGCTNIGAVCLENGGGGHEAAGTCQIANEDAGRVLDELVNRIRITEETGRTSQAA